MAVARNCETEWQYFQIDKPAPGKVISHLAGSCRYNIAASTIVVTTTGDTIRVLEFCTKAKFKESDSVLITPVSPLPVSKRSVININFDCKVKRTAYASITKVK